jgi:membrane protein YdbS with pleckstrin-like domain
METLKPKLYGHLVRHYLRIVPLAIVFIALGAYILVGGLKFDTLVGWAALSAGILIIVFGLVRSGLYSVGATLYTNDGMIVYKTGILSVHENKIPIEKVTDSALNRSVMERIFGLTTLSINTSGGIAYEVMCEGLDYNDANQFQTKILKANKES